MLKTNSQKDFEFKKSDFIEWFNNDYKKNKKKDKRSFYIRKRPISGFYFYFFGGYSLEDDFTIDAIKKHIKYHLLYLKSDKEDEKIENYSKKDWERIERYSFYAFCDFEPEDIIKNTHRFDPEYNYRHIVEFLIGVNFQTYRNLMNRAQNIKNDEDIHRLAKLYKRISFKEEKEVKLKKELESIDEYPFWSPIGYSKDMKELIKEKDYFFALAYGIVKPMLIFVFFIMIPLGIIWSFINFIFKIG